MRVFELIDILNDQPPDTEVETTGPDVISMTIPASPKFVRLVRIGAASIGRRRGLSVRAIDDLRLAVDGPLHRARDYKEYFAVERMSVSRSRVHTGVKHFVDDTEAALGLLRGQQKLCLRRTKRMGLY